MVADADGDVQTATFSSNSSRCTQAFTKMFDGKYTLRVYENAQSEGGGLLAGRIDDLRPSIAVHLNKQHSYSTYASPFAILAVNNAFTIEQYSWENGSSLQSLWSPAQGHGLYQGPFAFADDAIFWGANSLEFHKVKVYTPAGGVRDFISAGLVIDHGHDDLGTDGHDLVWIEARGRTSGGLTPFDHYDIMTSPYTNDPSQVKPRRVRSEPHPVIGLWSFIVGCGYGVHMNNWDTRVVRLADGVSWVLPRGLVDTDRRWSWSTPLAVTCTELFTDIRIKGETYGHLARVRLDSLGPGTPPD